MKKFFISAFLILSVISLNFVQAAFADAEEEYTLYDFENVSGSVYPDDAWRSYSQMWNIEQCSDDTSRGKILVESSSNVCGGAIALGRNNFTGTVHYGFDVKTLKGSYFNIFLLDARANMEENSNVNFDVERPVKVLWHWKSHNGLVVKYPNDERMSQQWKTNEWNHIDIVVDVASNCYITWTIYINDVLQTRCGADIVGGFKGIGWTAKDEDTTDSNTNVLSLDDVYVCNYPKNADGTFARRLAIMLGSKTQLNSVSDCVHMVVNDKINWNEIVRDGRSVKDFVAVFKDNERVSGGFDIIADEDGRGFTVKTADKNSVDNLRTGAYRIQFATDNIPGFGEEYSVRGKLFGVPMQ